MNQFRKLSRWAWSILVVCALAFAMGGCEGDTGPQGAQGETGAQGPQGDPGEDATKDPVVDAIAAANVESCSVCHDGAGGFHQSVYNVAYDESEFVLNIDDVTSTPDNGGFLLEIDFSIAYMGEAFDVDPASDMWVQSLTFRPVEWDDVSGTFVRPGAPFAEFAGITGPVTSNGGGSYTLTSSVGYDVNAWDSGSIVGIVGDDYFDFPDNPYGNPPPRQRRWLRSLPRSAVSQARQCSGQGRWHA